MGERNHDLPEAKKWATTGNATATERPPTDEKRRTGRRRFLAGAGAALAGLALGSGAASARVTRYYGGRGPVLGGGEGYGDTVPPSAATTTVSSADELASALDAASEGDVVYVAGDADIDLGGRELAIPAGITLASNRGIGGAPGGRIGTEQDPWPMFEVGAGTRVTGLRIAGPHDAYLEYDENRVSMGLRATGSGVVFDNNDVSGFSHAAIRTAGDTHVHHNHVHHNPMDGIGYGVSTTTGHPVIEYNYMNYNRHSVASSGGNGYTVRFNHFGPDAIDHVIDCHPPGGTTLEIHHNTVEAVTQVQNDETPEAVAVRGVPDDVADVHHNWLFNDNEPKERPEGWDGSAITQVNVDDWAHLTFEHNHYGSDEPGGDVGSPR